MADDTDNTTDNSSNDIVAVRGKDTSASAINRGQILSTIATSVLGGILTGGPGLLLGLLPYAKGIMDKRLYQNELDKRSQDQYAATQADNDLGQQITAARQLPHTGVQDQQLDGFQKRQDMLRALMGHPNPQVRSYAEQQLLGLNTSINDYLGGLQTEQDKQLDLQNQLRGKMRDDYRSDIGKAQDAVDKEQASYNEVMNSLQNLGAQNHVTQTSFSKYLNSTTEEGGKVAIPGLEVHLHSPEDQYTYDEIVRGSAAKLSSVKQVYQQRADALIKSAQTDGFQLNNDNGRLSFTDLNIVKPTGASPVPSTSSVQTADADNKTLQAAKTGTGVGRILNMIPVLPKVADDIVGPLGGQTGEERINEAQQLIQQQRQRRALREGIIRRPTN